MPLVEGGGVGDADALISAMVRTLAVTYTLGALAGALVAIAGRWLPLPMGWSRAA